MSKKFIYVNSDGDYEESLGAYEEADFVSVSTGASDAGKPVVLDVDGNIDASMINDVDIDHNNLTNSHNLTTDIDHNTITNTHNLTTDIDHNQLTNYDSAEHVDWSQASAGTIDSSNYPDALLADGSRNATAVLSYDANKTFSSDAQIVSKKYVDDAVASAGTAAEWQDSVIDRLATPPGTPSSGDRYLVIATASGDWVGHEDDIAEWNGSAWTYYTPSTGTYVSVDDETDGIYYYNGSAWAKHFYESTTASYGLEKVGVDIRANVATGGGIKVNGSDELVVEPNDFAGAGLVDDGADNLAIDWASAVTDEKAWKASDLYSSSGAGYVGIADSGGYTSETTVEGALQELYGLTEEASGIDYSVGTGGVSKGDLVYISGNNTILPYANIQNAEIAIGVAAETVAAGNTVKVLSNDTIITGVLTGATAGTKYYWTGSGWTTNFSSFASGDYIWTGGVSKNGTDVHVEVSFVMRKA